MARKEAEEAADGCTAVDGNTDRAPDSVEGSTLMAGGGRGLMRALTAGDSGLRGEADELDAMDTGDDGTLMWFSGGDSSIAGLPCLCRVLMVGRWARSVRLGADEYSGLLAVGASVPSRGSCSAREWNSGS